MHDLILIPDPNIPINDLFIVTDGKIQLDWEAYTGHRQMTVRDFYEHQPLITTLLRETVRFEEASNNPAYYRRVHLGELESWSAPAYLPAYRLRFHEKLNLEESVRDMNQVDGANNYAALTTRLTLHLRFRKIVGLTQPVAVIQGLVRPN